MSELTKAWFDEIKKLEIGEALFFRVADKKEQTKLSLEIEEERKNFSKIDPLHASQLFILKTLKNLKQYVVVERKFRTPYTAFLKKASGEMEKLTIDPERKRQIFLMVKDEKKREEIEEALNGLTEEEVKEFYF